jgi:hypothetical protein
MSKELTVTADTAPKRATKALEVATNMQVNDDATYQEASVFRKQVFTFQKAIKQEKDKVLAPLKEAVEAERNRWKPAEDALAQADTEVKSKMERYYTEKERKAREEATKVQKQFEEGKIKRVETVVRKVEAIEKAPEAEHSNIRHVRDIEIVDTGVIPKEYWMLDMVMLRNDVLKENVNVPGVRVITKTVVGR